MKKDLISFSLWSRAELEESLSLAHKLKSNQSGPYTPLAHKSAALIFEKESLRTRVSFEVGIAQLGGHPVFLQNETIGIATRESVHDIGVVLSHYNELIIARTTRHQTLVQLAESATIPVVNAMTDLVHPCQVLADAFTLQELGKFNKTSRIVFLGHGNNIVNSWLELAEKFPLHFIYSCPTGFEPHEHILEQAKSAGLSTIESIRDPREAIEGADVVYTDVWPPTADEGTRQRVFRQFQVNASLLAHAKRNSVVMHRLPASRGEEITTDILDGKQSIVLQQAENRLHVEKAIIGIILSRRS